MIFNDDIKNYSFFKFFDDRTRNFTFDKEWYYMYIKMCFLTIFNNRMIDPDHFFIKTDFWLTKQECKIYHYHILFKENLNDRMMKHISRKEWPKSCCFITKTSCFHIWLVICKALHNRILQKLCQDNIFGSYS